MKSFADFKKSIASVGKKKEERKPQKAMEVADAGEVMPPKSTWFEPKLKSGLVSHLLD